jgi:APA family basic amino acid/polyamine antiporter
VPSGSGGEKAIAVLVAVAALTSINATMIVGARTGYAMGRDWRPLAWLARWDGERATRRPWPCCCRCWRRCCWSAWARPRRGLPRHGRIHRAGVLAVLPAERHRAVRAAPARTRRAAALPGAAVIPLLPLLFCASCAYMLWSSLSLCDSQSLGGLNAAWIGVAVLAAGVLLLAAAAPGRSLPRPCQRPDRHDDP